VLYQTEPRPDSSVKPYSTSTPAAGAPGKSPAFE
jgi:hypothetical protein